MHPDWLYFPLGLLHHGYPGYPAIKWPMRKAGHSLHIVTKLTMARSTIPISRMLHGEHREDFCLFLSVPDDCLSIYGLKQTERIMGYYDKNRSF
jgi:hypothetical protein